MKRNDMEGKRGFHELPLVLFTALTTAGAGVGTAHLALSALGWVPLLPSRWVTMFIGAMLGLGLLFSIGHLGRPFRGAFALLGVGRSPLSNEVLVVSVAILSSLGSVVIPAGHSLWGPVTVVALVSSALTLIALGLVYKVPGQLTWNGGVWVQPLVLGGAFGLAVLMESLPLGTRARGELLVLLVLSLDGLLVWERAARMTRALRQGIPSHSSFLRWRGIAFSARVLVGIVLPAAALLLGWLEVVGVALFLNLFLDRFLFYGLAVRYSTVAEVDRVESALRAAPDPPSMAPIPPHPSS